MSVQLNLDDLQAYIDRHAIPARLIRDIGHTPTVPDAARVLGVEPDQIIKTLVFVLTPGSKEGSVFWHGNITGLNVNITLHSTSAV